MTFPRLLVLVLLACCTSGCVLTKLLTTPMRLGGAVVSIAPVVGNPANDALREADDAVNTAADKVDDLPI